jgi:hypothetical protein
MPVFNRNRHSGSSGGVAAAYTIDNSIRLNDDDSAYMHRVIGSDGDSKQGTFSLWVKRGNLAINTTLLEAAESRFYFTAADKITHYLERPSRAKNLTTTAVYRDPSAWQHIFCNWDTTPSTPESELWVNGVQVSSFSTNTNNLSQNDSGTYWDSGKDIQIGRIGTGSLYFDGYIAELHGCDGLTQAVTDFGEFDSNGNWVPIEYAGAHGDEGFYLDFAVAPGTGNGAGTDVSGNANHFTDSGLAANDQTNDSPSDDADNNVGNYPTFNPLNNNVANVISNGNRQINNTTNAFRGATMNSTIRLGETAYWETLLDNGIRVYIGLCKDSTDFNVIGDVNIEGGQSNYTYAIRITTDNTLYFEGADQSATYSAATAGQIAAIGITSDGEVKIYVNNSLIYTYSQKLEAGFDYTPAWSVNGYVAEELTIQAGPGDLTYSLPTGTTALDTASRPAPAIKDPTDGFIEIEATEANIVSSVAAARSGWTNYIELYKNKDAVEDWDIKFSDDSSNSMNTHSTAAPATFPTLSGSNAFLGMAIRADAGYGCFTGTVSHTNGADTDTAHGLGSNPKMAIVKLTSTTGNWYVVHPVNTSGYNLVWNNVAAENTTEYAAIDGTNVTVKSAAPSGTYRYWAMEEIPGFSSLAAYTGNNNANGTFVTMGMTPAAVGLFNATADHSILWTDSMNTADVGNPHTATFMWRTVTSVGDDVIATAGSADFVSNGMKLRSTSYSNAAVKYGVMAWAKSPFGGVGVSQARAR